MGFERTRKHVRSAFFSLAIVCALTGAASSGCKPARGTVPLKRCEEHCRRDLPSCDEESCVRGCRAASDREVEGYARGVFACVARANDCSERSFVRCAVTQGIHADGGPPVPPSYPDDD
jgi:hypothetical protein